MIFTPHPGEASRMAGVPTGEIESDRVRAGQATLAERSTLRVVVLKGAGTVIASPPKDRSALLFVQEEIPVWQRGAWETC